MSPTLAAMADVDKDNSPARSKINRFVLIKNKVLNDWLLLLIMVEFFCSKCKSIEIIVIIKESDMFFIERMAFCCFR